MKRKLAILLLFCFSFYHFGYYLFYFSYKYKVESDWVVSLHTADRAFNKEHLIKIPLIIPYMPDQEDFHNTNTSFRKNGKTYRVVKQRYVQDTLQVVYVPDTALNKLDQTIKGWIATLTDGIDQEASNGKVIPKNFIKDYLQPLSLAGFAPLQVLIIHRGFFTFCCHKNVHIDLSDPPPEMPKFS